MSNVMSWFSDMETGTVILIVAVLALFIYFGGKNVLRDDGKGGNKKHGSGGTTGGGTDA